MSALRRVTYYALPRDEDGRIADSSHIGRLFTMALRWMPEVDGRDEALSVLRRLASGDDVSERHLLPALDYLTAAAVHYGTEPEPYPGRNLEAIRDLDTLRLVLS